MRKILFLLCSITSTLQQTNFKNATAVEENNEFRSLVNTVNENIFSFLAEKSLKENVVISPLSISVALSLLYHGSAGASRRQLKNALNFPDSDLLLIQSSEFINKIEESQSNVTVRMGNGVFLNNGFTAKKRYVDLLETEYDAQVETLEDGTDKVDIVNSWISEKTEGAIENFLTEGSIDEATQMLLINAIYFYGPWLFPFEKSLTSLGKFYTDDSRREYVAADFMDLEESLDLVDDPGKMKAVILPYSDTNYSMIIYLPYPNISINQLAQEINTRSQGFNSLLQRARNTKMNFQIPRFNVNTKNSLVEALEYLNVTNLFDERAELNRISDENIVVGDILHSASVKIDEEGSEAAGVTSVSIDIRTAVTGPVTLLRVDTPFLFSIVDKEGFQLFTGKIMNPTGKLPLPETSTLKTSDLPDDTILSVHSVPALPNPEGRNPDLHSESNSEEESHTVQIQCPRGKMETAKFASCETFCKRDGEKSYGSCAFQCWEQFCM